MRGNKACFGATLVDASATTENTTTDRPRTRAWQLGVSCGMVSAMIESCDVAMHGVVNDYCKLTTTENRDTKELTDLFWEGMRYSSRAWSRKDIHNMGVALERSPLIAVNVLARLARIADKTDARQDDPPPLSPVSGERAESPVLGMIAIVNPFVNFWCY